MWDTALSLLLSVVTADDFAVPKAMITGSSALSSVL
ncbi:hypothetical protein NRB56_53150 [Nocardia sp. RB56]|uniref:Uncharacterized protein n=1 Tax=Nocardia aurantia TaxID=2585199 RepID=A0A7K0DWP4_9NOCA|nr:hypothetical protein [Nocardia aurantia]